MIGHRGPMRTADIRSAVDVAQVVDDAVRQGLRNQGFTLVDPGATAPHSLLIEVRALSYETSAGFFTGGIHARSMLKARANRPGDIYEQVYRSENEERVIVVPTEASDSEQINRALSVAIDQMLADQHLLSFLAGQGAAGDVRGATEPAGITPNAGCDRRALT